MNHEPSPPVAAPVVPAELDYRVIDVGKFVLLLWRRRYTLAAGAILGFAAGLLVILLVHPRYDAIVRLMPPDHKESLIASLSPSRNEGDLYLGLLSSQTVADDVIAHQHLADYTHLKKPSDLRGALGAMSTIEVDKNQFITVTVRAKEPETAVRIANEYPNALYRLNHAIAVSQAAHRLEYVSGPLEQERDRLAEAEDRLKEAQQKTGIVQPEAQIQLGLNAIAQLKQQITNLNEQLSSILAGSTDQNPEVVRLRAQISSANGQLARLEAQNGSSSVKASTPELTLEIERLTRDVRFHQNLMDLLSKQYENARFDDSYSPPIELVDRATLPDYKAWPSRKRFGLVGLIAGFFLALVYVCYRR